MKYFITTILLLIISVTLSYYLLNNSNFVPITELGEYNWINIFTLLILLSTALFSLLNLVIFGALSVLKKVSTKEKIIGSVKISFFLTLGLFVVFVLNFFHILNWTWGVSILLVVLIFTFII